MKIDFKNEVLKRKDEMISELQKLIQIPSELTTFDPNRKGAPFGEANKEALEYMLSLGKKDGFNTVNLDGYAGHIEYGSQKDFVGMIGHLDVVPAGNDWTFEPYGATIHEGKMYGRGTEDDKGPTMAVYYALKILKELNVPLSKRIKLILGSDEESGWRCVRHYFSIYPEAPVSGFIPDADFPLIYAEKGIVLIEFKGAVHDHRIVSIDGGFRVNMVPDYAQAKLIYDASTEEKFNQYLKINKSQATIEKKEDHLIIKFIGKSAHGSTPELGLNAIDALNDFLLYAGYKNDYTHIVDTFLAHDTKGEKLGVSYTDPEMGALTNNFGVVKVENGQYTIGLNLRYPNGITLDTILKQIKKALPSDVEIATDHHQLLLYNDPKSPLVTKLMDIYKKHTGEKDAKPITIGGGTFARAMPNVVAFGPHFLGKPSYIHQKDEYIEIEDLIKATIIYTEALYELAK